MKVFNFLNNKKDRYIAYFIMSLIIYSLIQRNSIRIADMLLLHIAPYQLNYFCAPEGYGNIAVTVLVMSLIIIGVRLLRKEGLRKTIFIGMSGFVVSIALLIGYRVHGKILVNYAANNEPASIQIRDEVNNTRLTLEEESPYKEQVHQLVMSLEKENKKEKGIMNDKVRENKNKETYNIRLTYPKKHGIITMIQVEIEGELVYFQNGHGEYEVTYVKDNGLRELVNQLMK